MHSKRVNVYMGANDTPVYYQEEYSHEINAWVTVGAVYEDYDLARAIAENFNSRIILDKITKLSGAQS